MLSEELPTLLRYWHNSPQNLNSKNKHPKGAKIVMEKFAINTSQEVLENCMEEIAEIMSSPEGANMTEETLMGTKFNDIIEGIKLRAFILLQLIHSLAYSAEQTCQNSAKTADKACFDTVKVR